MVALVVVKEVVMKRLELVCQQVRIYQITQVTGLIDFELQILIYCGEKKCKNNSNENETQEYSRNSKEKGATQLMNINIYIMRGNETLSWEDLNAKEKQEIGSALNQQALTSIGYKPDKEERR